MACMTSRHSVRFSARHSFGVVPRCAGNSERRRATRPAVDAVARGRGVTFEPTTRATFFVWIFLLMRLFPAPDSAPTPHRSGSWDAAVSASLAGSHRGRTAPSPLRRGRVLGLETSDEEM